MKQKLKLKNLLYKIAKNLLFNLKKKIPHWDKKLVDGQSPTARSLFTEESSDGEYV